MERGFMFALNTVILIYLLIVTLLMAIGNISFIGYTIILFMTVILTIIIEGLCLFLSNWKLYDGLGKEVFNIEKEMNAIFRGILKGSDEK